jgi:lipopolysaccharide heptosyltransferase II
MVVTIPQRLVVLAPNWLGDAVMALPLLNDIRRSWPGSHLAVAARGSVAALFEMVPGVAEVLRFEGNGGSAVRHWRSDARLLQQGRFDAALLLPNSFLAAWLAARAGIPERWGFARDLRARLLTRPIARPRGPLHQAEYYQRLAPALGLSSSDGFARVDIAESAHARARDLLNEVGLTQQRYVVCAPGAAYGRAKQWLPERYAELAALLGRDRVATVLVGTEADRAVCARIVRRADREASIVDLSGKTDLPTVAAVMSGAEATIANDSGAMHLASAAGSRVVAIFGPTDHRQTAPLRADAAAPPPVIVATRVWCRPCMLRECPIDHRCMRRITARAVLDSLRS